MRVYIDLGDTAPSEKWDMGRVSIVLPDEKVKEYVEAFVMLGYSPEVTFE